MTASEVAAGYDGVDGFEYVRSVEFERARQEQSRAGCCGVGSG